MTQDQLDLLHGYLNGTLDEAGFARFQSLLRESAEARRTLRSLSTVEAKLTQLAAIHPETVRLLSETARQSGPSFRWLSWRPLTAAAAGIIFGMFCTSVVFGYVMPRAVATASRLFALVDGSFEKTMGRVASGFPSEFGKWSGDEAEAVEESSVEGSRALRFVRAEREPALPNYGAASCDVYQLVDLRSLKADADPGEATLELSARFMDARQKAGEKVKFICRLYTFSGAPDSLPAEWPLSQKEALAAGSGTFDSFGGAPATWQPVTTKVLLPPGADFAVIHLVVHKPKTPTGTEAVFGDQFADDVRLTLKTQPVLPVRLAQR
jgi:hypothetical protein